jgi:translation elongation factor P/translation initiation factor 5A
MTLHTDSNTTIEINGESGKRVVDLRAGQKVIVQGDPTGIVTDIQAKQSKHRGGRLRIR